MRENDRERVCVYWSERERDRRGKLSQIIRGSYIPQYFHRKNFEISKKNQKIFARMAQINFWGKKSI